MYVQFLTPVLIIINFTEFGQNGYLVAPIHIQMSTAKDLRKHIIDNAQEVFSRFGLKKTTMDEIASTINKAKSSVYYYFKSKEEIYEAVIEKEATIFRNEILEALKKAETPRDKIKTYILTRMALFQNLANFYTAFQKEYIENYTFIHNIRQKYDNEEIQMIIGILQEGVQSHHLVVKDVNLTALAIITAMKGFEYTWALEKETFKLEGDIDVLLDILFYGLIQR